MNWKYVKKLKNNESIGEFEKEYSFIFPDDYKTCIILYNGGRPEFQVFDTDKQKERTIKSLLSFNKADIETIWKMAEWNKEITKEKYIPFASDNYGNLICFKKEDSSVNFIDHENENIEFIASSFTEFLGKLYNLGDEHVSDQNNQ